MSGNPAGALAICWIVVAVLPGGCGREFRGVHEYPLPGGKVIVEIWDDPFDNLKSRRLFWQEDGSEEREEVGEVWGSVNLALGPQLAAPGPLTLVWGPHCFQRRGPDDWQKCPAIAPGSVTAPEESKDQSPFNGAATP
jgi:hypothetical protein